MEFRKGYLVGLLALTLGFSSIAAAYEPTAAENQEMQAYIVAIPGLAVEFEKAGDRALGAGDSATAIKDYAHAISLIMLTPGYHINFWGTVHASQGWELHGIEPGPGYTAGLKDGDILTAVNGAPIATLSRVAAYISIYDDAFNPPTLTVIRGGAAPFDIKLGLPELDINDDLTLAKWADANRLLEKQVALYAKMTTRPPIPKEARRLAAKGQELAKSATTSAQIKAASDQYK